MDTAGKVLDLLFRQASPDRLLQSLKERIEGSRESFLRTEERFRREREDQFMDFAESTLHGYSENEQALLYQQLEQIKSRWEKQTAIPSGFLTFLIRFGQNTLITVGGEPRCRAERALFWRDAYLYVGQDTIVCPFLAFLDYRNGVIRSDFTWPAVLRTDSDELYRMLGQGMAENHNHINGGTQSFSLSWCRLMNYPEMIRTELKHFQGSNLRSRMTRRAGDSKMDQYEQLELAALIRSILFRALHRSEYRNAALPQSEERSLSDEDRSAFNGGLAFQNEYIRTFSFRNGLNNTVDCLKVGHGAWLDYPNGERLCLDYALDNGQLQHCVNPHLRLLAGERLFLYQCTRESLREGGLDSFEQGLLYLYLLLKCNFRSEMIQANGQTGFKNFLRYQDRKDDAWDGNPYFWEAARMALNYRLTSGTIVSMENRLVPKADPAQNIRKVSRFDLAKRFADCTPSQALDHANYDFDPELDVGQFVHLPYFFVYHFIKAADHRYLRADAFRETPCRHQVHRQAVRAAAIGLAAALQRSSYLRNRVRGIDASANEIGCRPEVFASAYRYLSGVQQKWNTRLNQLLPTSSILISKTYHAGEDFLDIADGLRAIDEAITFLALPPGSRIGHALAMGVAPESHYNLKSFEIVTTKQDRLDDLVWLLYRTKELGVPIEGKLESTLQREAYHLFREIYGDAVEREHWVCGLIDYYHSMKLRGDDPSVYRVPTELHIPMNTADEFDHYLIDNSSAELVEYRKETCVRGLYHRYHYGAEEGILGRETLTCTVSEAYIRFMRQAQEGMQRYLAERGIIVECNPSSNVLIGTFKRYDQHPIFRFNSRKLPSGQVHEGVPLHVCLNTDDLGIFDTSLDFEYALIGQALLAQKDGTLYNYRDVMEYLNDLREMGLTAVFPENI